MTTGVPGTSRCRYGGVSNQLIGRARAIGKSGQGIDPVGRRQVSTCSQPVIDLDVADRDQLPSLPTATPVQDVRSTIRLLAVRRRDAALRWNAQ